MLKSNTSDQMFNVYLPYLSMIDPLPSTRNEDKLGEIRKKYSETRNMPRKRKKKLRKELNQEYSFWYSIGEWEKSMYEF